MSSPACKWNIIWSMKTYGPTVQCSAKSYIKSKCSNCLFLCPGSNSCHQPKFKYSTDQSHDEWPSAECFTNCQSGVALTDGHLAHVVDRPAPVIHRTKVWDFRKLQVECYHDVWLTPCDETPRWLCAHVPRCAVLLRLQLVSLSSIK